MIDEKELRQEFDHMYEQAETCDEYYDGTNEYVTWYVRKEDCIELMMSAFKMGLEERLND